MDFSFVKALDDLGPDAAFTIANAARPEASYLLNSFLPERASEEYNVERGKMTVRSTMAGVVAMDSPYPSGGFIDVDTFSERTLKVANSVAIPEAALRTLQYQMARLQAAGGSTTESLLNEALNFYNKVILQAHFDMSEWLRGQALTKGALNFTFNGKSIAVDYGVPAANKFTTRTGTDAYSGTTSKFWDDVRSAQQILRGGISTILCNSATAADIVYNSANDIRVIASGPGFWQVQRLVNSNGVVNTSEDVRDVARIVMYDQEGDLSNPEDGDVQNVKFIEDGYVVFLGNNHVRGYEVGQGSTPDPWNDTVLGYTHLAPTVEGGGAPGRWGRLIVPQNEPWKIIGEAVSNQLPVILAPEKIVIASTAMAA